MTLINFVRNYNDESTERGFQFEFYCDRCGTGYRTSFKASATGVVSEALDVASGLLGGVFGKAASVGDRIHSEIRVASWVWRRVARLTSVPAPRSRAWVTENPTREAYWSL